MAELERLSVEAVFKSHNPDHERCDRRSSPVVFSAHDLQRDEREKATCVSCSRMPTDRRATKAVGQLAVLPRWWLTNRGVVPKGNSLRWRRKEGLAFSCGYAEIMKAERLDPSDDASNLGDSGTRRPAKA